MTLGGPEDAWLKTWGMLAEQRRIFKHRWSDDQTRLVDDPSFFLANIGLMLIDLLLDPLIGNVEQADDLSSAVFDATFGMIAFPPSFNSGRWRNLFASLFCRLPYIASDENRDIAIAGKLLRIGGDAELFVWCLANALLNGAEIVGLAHKLRDLASIDLEQVLVDYIAWENRESNRQPNKRLSEECQKILTLLKNKGN